MTHYFFDTSGMFGIFRKQQHTNISGGAVWEALSASASPSGAGWGAPKIVVSAIMPYEAIRSLFLKDQSQNTILEMTKFEVERRSWTVVEVTREVLQNASELMGKYALKSFDAIHLACALKAKTDYGDVIFVTQDKMLRNAAKEEGVTAMTKNSANNRIATDGTPKEPWYARDIIFEDIEGNQKVVCSIESEQDIMVMGSRPMTGEIRNNKTGDYEPIVLNKEQANDILSSKQNIPVKFRTDAQRQCILEKLKGFVSH